jgi:hypothetical protein
MNYKCYELGLSDDGWVELLLEGIMTGRTSEVDKYLRENMKAGDTYQEFYPDDTTSPLNSYEDMLANWAELDDYKF